MANDGFFIRDEDDTVYITHHALDRFITRFKPDYVNLSCIGKKAIARAKMDLFEKTIDAVNNGMPIQKNGGYDVFHKGIEFVLSFPGQHVKLITVMDQNNTSFGKFKNKYKS